MENFFALIIGVGGDLKATIADASSIYNLLIDPNKGGYDSNNVYYLINEESTKDNILLAFDNIIKKTKAIENATVVIYYSGHGARYENKNQEYEYYLKIYGSDKTKKEETMLNGNLFSKKVNKIKSEKLLVLLDCCHAAGIQENELIIKGDSSGSNRELLERLNSGKGRVFISSCDDAEESVILPESTNSLFTEVTLEALNGLTSTNEEFIGVIDLIYHVIKEVPKRVKPFNHIQRPIITEIRNLSPDYFVCRNGNYKSLNIDAPFSGKLDTRNRKNLAEKPKINPNAEENLEISDQDISMVLGDSESMFDKYFDTNSKINFIKQYPNKIK
jgi:hypothetical protein